ncbi:hypothetical protein MKW98_028211 [Papaver atlanticum]|uniref:Uncharacterized protein n=1 Tax=Papaver atlanticum TaxID=357466 RepID=A0AAD4SY92_9MAGN|nr:hypothetical protein MKW98_028211 [Papaver atlanticum]
MAASFGSATKLTSISVIFLAIILSSLSNSCVSESTDPTPTPWPPQFHSITIMNNSGTHQIINLWYDYPNGRNFNIIQKKFDVGILTPDWLDGANYLGQQKVDGFLCNVWEKVDFIWYYEDVVTKRPVHWVFFTGMEAHLMTFEVGAVLEDEKWQAPVYCFESGEQADDSSQLNSVVDNSDLEDVFKRKMLIRR